MGESSADGGARSLEGRERAAVWNLWSVRGVQFHHLERMRQRLDSRLNRFWQLGVDAAEQLLAESRLGESAAARILEMLESGIDVVERYREERSRLPEGSRMIHLRDADYPSRLLDLEEPPEFLYVRGAIESCRRDDAISVVGSRDAPVSEVRRARTIVGQLAAAGLAVVSGGALGIDRAAHESALEAGGETAVVLPSGLDRTYPVSNRDVFERAVERGALVTEYPLGVEVRRYHFPRRNRLIAALGDATFVVRAGPDSGTMLTADAAKELERPICALAGGLEEPLVEGCLELIVEGAQAVRGADDVLRQQFPHLAGEEASNGASGGASDRRGGEPDLSGLSEDARRLAEAVRTDGAGGADPRHVDQLRELVGWSTGRLQTALLELELHGVCEKTGGAHAFRFS